jgi:hypothetical protein
MNLRIKGVGKMNIKIVVLLIFALSFSCTGEIYKVYVDGEFGFWAMRPITDNHTLDINKTINYAHRTLDINTGDTIIWENADAGNGRLTIMSDNLLWEGGRVLGGPTSISSFTFNSSGAYIFHIVERSRFEANITEQNLSSYDEETDSWTNETITLPYTILYFPYQSQTIKVTGKQVGKGTFPVTYKINQPTSTGATTGTTTNVTTNATANISINDKYKTEIQIGKEPVTNVTKMTPKPTPIVTPKPVTIVTPRPLESYQEFTLYETLKRWFTIIDSSQNMS